MDFFMKQIVDIDAAKSWKSKNTAAVHKHRFVADRTWDSHGIRNCQLNINSQKDCIFT